MAPLKLVALFVGIMISFFNLIAQQWALQAENGFVIPHHDYMSYFINNNTRSFHVQYHYKNPTLLTSNGFAYSFSTLGNSNIYGNAHSAYFFTGNTWNLLKSRTNPFHSFQMGLAYFNKEYDVIENKNNTVIGSHINIHFAYFAGLNINVSKQSQLKIYGGITHYSNGNIKAPNLGINIMKIGASYQFATLKPIGQKSEPFPFANETKEKQISKFTINKPIKGQIYLITAVSYSSKEVSRRFPSSYPIYGGHIEIFKVLQTKHHAGISLSSYYDKSNLIEEKLNNDGKKIKSFKQSLHFNYYLHKGRYAFIFQPGFYTIRNNINNHIICNKLGFRYHITNRIAAGMNIRAHWFALADFIEFSTFYKWNIKK